MSEPTHDELLAIARAATAGRYTVFTIERGKSFALLPAMRPGEIATFSGDNADADVTFAQTFSPARAISLLEQLQAANETADDYEKAHEPLHERLQAAEAALDGLRKALEWIAAHRNDHLTDGSAATRACLDAIVAKAEAALSAPVEPQRGDRVSAPEILADRIAEVLDEGDGFWRACSGCQESVDGHVSSRDYPRSKVFRCQPGGGCRECGGLGVIWDSIDYGAMAEAMLADEVLSAEEQFAADEAEHYAPSTTLTPAQIVAGCRAMHEMQGSEDADSLIHQPYQMSWEEPTKPRWSQWIETVAAVHAALSASPSVPASPLADDVAGVIGRNDQVVALIKIARAEKDESTRNAILMAALDFATNDLEALAEGAALAPPSQAEVEITQQPASEA